MNVRNIDCKYKEVYQHNQRCELINIETTAKLELNC